MTIFLVCLGQSLFRTVVPMTSVMGPHFILESAMVWVINYIPLGIVITNRWKYGGSKWDWELSKDPQVLRMCVPSSSVPEQNFMSVCRDSLSKLKFFS